MNATLQEAHVIQDFVRAAVARLVSVESVAGAHFVTTPLMYASGGYVVVRIEQNGENFFVSDFGAGFEEALLMGGEGIYRRQAKTIAETVGISFDDAAFFFLTANKDQLIGAVAVIANASQEAVNLTAMRIAERRHKDNSELLIERLRSVYDPKFVARDVEIVGASNTKWHLTSVVTVKERKLVFEAVSEHKNSVIYAAAKFGDLARLENAPGRVAVVVDKKALGTYLGVLSHNANVIEQSVSDQVYQRLLERAA
ncbi:hypothetical protein [Neogemmobacter tilapiae]|uniref:DUF1828 domain-containing protein n=1 Tax=Neogemmobacter tilapiae TaxID=875041 RepID=A0A918TTS3_9RHOB|nr:hypothetical protein [Gemmobacter tilapiae]GHC63192.1 hypothetical protein GCM10007315_29190 [Gemmobacter tilapiae]